MITKEMLVDMLTKQEAVNNVMTGNGELWRDLHRPWYRAIWRELSECTDHISWEWWKTSKVDWPQLHLEIVDVFHFILSSELNSTEVTETYMPISEIAEHLEVAFSMEGDCDVGYVDEQERMEKTMELLESMIAGVILNCRAPYVSFSALMNISGFSWTELHAWYVGKNRLNHFRQANGDKTGSYSRTWRMVNGEIKADNEFLEYVITVALPDELQSFPDTDVSGFIDNELSATYAYHCSITV